MGKLTKEQQTLIVALVIVIAGTYVYWTYFLKRTLAEIDRKDKQYNELRAKVQVAQEQARRLPVLQAEFTQLQVELSSMEKQLPTEKDFPGILRIITREAVQENLQFQSLRPLDPKRDASNFFDVLEFEVQMSGSLQSFIRFMSSLGQQDRIFQFERLNVQTGGGADDAANVNATFLLRTYAYVG